LKKINNKKIKKKKQPSPLGENENSLMSPGFVIFPNKHTLCINKRLPSIRFKRGNTYEMTL